jgi:hypothetical protein
VHVVDAGGCALRLEALELPGIGHRLRDRASRSGEVLRLLENFPLRGVVDRHLPLAPALRPARLEDEAITTIGPLRPDLDRLLAPQTEGGLELEREPGAGVGELLQVASREFLRAADVRADAVPVVPVAQPVGDEPLVRSASR